MTDTTAHQPPAAQIIEDLQRKFLELQIKNLEDKSADHEKRIRLLEESATKFNFLLYLTLGNGFMAIISLIKLFV